jgi:uncharacterized membrane protein (DUF106 family)
VTAGGTPLRSAAPAAEPEEFDEPVGAAPEAEETTSEPEPTAAPARPATPRPTFKFSTMIIFFLGFLGLWMLIDTQFRNQIACSLGTYAIPQLSPTPQCPAGWGPLYYLIGFDSHFLLLTMALAGALEMAITALAYNYTTDWVKQAKVAKWNAAFRKVQMDAIRSGKKDRIAALRPYQERLTRLSTEVTIGQFKGMAITYFMLILIYTWVGLTIADASSAQQTLNLGGTLVNVYTNKVFGYFPDWFFIFSLYTIPASMLFRRVLKEWWIRRFAERNHVLPKEPAPAVTPATP